MKKVILMFSGFVDVIELTDASQCAFGAMRYNIRLQHVHRNYMSIYKKHFDITLECHLFTIRVSFIFRAI